MPYILQIKGGIEEVDHAFTHVKSKQNVVARTDAQTPD